MGTVYTYHSTWLLPLSEKKKKKTWKATIKFILRESNSTSFPWLWGSWRLKFEEKLFKKLDPLWWALTWLTRPHKWERVPGTAWPSRFTPAGEGRTSSGSHHWPHHSLSNDQAQPSSEQVPRCTRATPNCVSLTKLYFHLLRNSFLFCYLSSKKSHRREVTAPSTKHSIIKRLIKIF